MRSVGVTGGIASGKSTVTAMLAEVGAAVIDADQLGHRAYAPGTETFRRVVDAFGDGIVGTDGAIDRRALGGLAFGGPDQMRRLTDLVWPAIRKLATEELAALRRRGVEVAVLEAALLIEAGWYDLVDEVWVLSVPPAVARERLKERDGWSDEEADRRIRAQMPNAEREAHADVVLRTDCSLDEVRVRVMETWRALRRRLLVMS